MGGWFRAICVIFLIHCARPSWSFNTPISMTEAGIPHGLRVQKSVQPDYMRVLLVRHGESTNNVLAKRVEEQYSSGSLTLEAAREEWFEKRSDDPDLTDRGREQAQMLAKVLAPQMGGGPNRAVLVSSPMRRAMRTAQPLAEALGQGVLVHPDMFESGGCYAKDMGPGQGGTREDIRREFGGGYDTRMLPEEGPWNGGKGKEDLGDAARRAARAAEWAISAEARAMLEGGGGGRAQLVIVCHADFIDLFLQQMVAIADARGEGGQGGGGGGARLSFACDNTSVSEVLVPVGAGPARLGYLNRMPHAHLLARL